MAHILTPPERDYPIGQRGAMGDRNGALALAFGVAAALLKRSRTGPGSVVDVSLLATAMWTLSSDVLAALGGDEPKASSGRGPLVNPLVGVYRTKDGRHIQLVFLQPDRYWADFCRVIDRPDLAEDPRFADIAARRENGAACVAELDEEFAKRTFDGMEGRSWPRSTRRGRPCSRSPSSLDDPQVEANGYIGDVVIDGEPAYRLPAVPVQFDGQAPAAAAGARARRGHRGDAARAGVRMGRDRRAQGGGGRPVTTAQRPVPVPDETSAPFWSSRGGAHARRRPLRALRQLSHPPDTVCPHCGSTDPSFEFDAGRRERSGPVVDRHAAVVPARVRRRPLRAGRRRAVGAGRICA